MKQDFSTSLLSPLSKKIVPGDSLTSRSGLGAKLESVKGEVIGRSHCPPPREVLF